MRTIDDVPLSGVQETFDEQIRDHLTNAQVQRSARNAAHHVPDLDDRIAMARARARELARLDHDVDLDAVLLLPRPKGKIPKGDARAMIPLIAAELASTVEGFTQQEAAEALGMTQQAVQKAVARRAA